MFKNLANVSTPRYQYEEMRFNSFPHGLNSVIPADRIAQTELSKVVNWKFRKGGKLETRPPVKVYSNTAVTSNAKVTNITEANIGGTLYTLVIDENDRLYYLDGSLDPVFIATLECQATILSYNGVALIMDGSYLKYLDGVTTSSCKICYDTGSGLSGYQFDKTALTNSTSLKLGDGTNLGVAQKFTTQAWTAGYTIPPVTVSCYLTENGTATAADITVKIRLASAPSTVLATKTFLSSENFSEITGTAAEFSATFASTDITTQLSPNTAYFATLEYTHASNDTDNCLLVNCGYVASGGLAYYGDTDLDVLGNWNADTTKHCLMSVTPGMPPKGSFGVIWNRRPWIGGDSDNPGYLWYGNLSHLDWSTADGGGYWGVVDSDSNNFEVGAVEAFYGNLYVFGVQSQPYLTKITGSSPSDYTQEVAFQNPWATNKTLVSAVNDIWYAGNEGVSPLSGVQEYGDLRTFYASDQVVDRIEDYWSSSTAFAGYYPQDGQYWLVMPTYHRVLVCHTKQAVSGPEGVSSRYPWTEYEFYRYDFVSDVFRWIANGDEYYLQTAAGGDPGFVAKPDFITLDGKVITEGTAGSLSDHGWDYGLDPTSTYNTIYFKDATGDPDTSGVEIRSIFLPTCMAQVANNFLLGSSDGFIYQVDTDGYRDMGNIQMLPVFQTAYIEIPFSHAEFAQIHLLASSRGGGYLRTKFYTDGAYADTTDTSPSMTTYLGVDDDLTVAEAIAAVEDAYFTITTDNTPLFNYVNFVARSIMVTMDNVLLAGYPIYNNGVMLKYRRLSE